MNIPEAQQLQSGAMLHHKTLKNADGTPQRFKVLSVKTWKTRPNLVCVSIKRGMYEYYRLTDADELEQFTEVNNG